MSRISKNSPLLLEKAIKELQSLLTSRSVQPEIPEELAKAEGFEQLHSTLLEIRTAIMSFSTGDLSYQVNKKGYVPGTLKALQAALHHLTWQTKMIASGDFTQRVDFMGDFSESFNTMVIQLDESMRKLSIANEQLRVVNLRLELIAHTDSLTGMNNRGYFMDLLGIELERARRHGKVFSILMLDIDHFKSVNDTYGHAAGDEALRTLSRVIQTSRLRKSDFTGRIGGEEFAIVLPETEIHGAAKLAERLRTNLATTPVKLTGSEFFMTASIGASMYRVGYTQEVLLQQADQALYKAKETGRNRVCLAS